MHHFWARTQRIHLIYHSNSFLGRFRTGSVLRHVELFTFILLILLQEVLQQCKHRDPSLALSTAVCCTPQNIKPNSSKNIIGRFIIHPEVAPTVCQQRCGASFCSFLLQRLHILYRERAKMPQASERKEKGTKLMKMLCRCMLSSPRFIACSSSLANDGQKSIQELLLAEGTIYFFAVHFV